MVPGRFWRERFGGRCHKGCYAGSRGSGAIPVVRQLELVLEVSLLHPSPILNLYLLVFSEFSA